MHYGLVVLEIAWWLAVKGSVHILNPAGRLLPELTQVHKYSLE